jgi:hypothetical protein
MPNFRYPFGNQKILEGEIPWLTAPVVAHLIGTQFYEPSTIHQTMADVPEDAVVATSGTLENRSATLGVADAEDVTWGTVPAGTTRGDAVILATDTGDRSTSVLIAYYGTIVGVPVYPDGSDITIHWDNGANKIFVL